MPVKHLPTVAQALGVSPANLVVGPTTDNFLGALLPAWNEYEQCRESFAWLRERALQMYLILLNYREELLGAVRGSSDARVWDALGLGVGEKGTRDQLDERVHDLSSPGFRQEVSQRTPEPKEHHAAYRAVPVADHDTRRLALIVDLLHTLDQVHQDDLELLGAVAGRLAGGSPTTSNSEGAGEEEAGEVR